MTSKVTIGKNYPWGKSTFETIKHTYTGGLPTGPMEPELEPLPLEVPTSVKDDLAEQTFNLGGIVTRDGKTLYTAERWLFIPRRENQ